MIKLKSLILETIKKRWLYHITPKKNILNMKWYGIQPTLLPEFCTKAICLFDDRTTMEDALMNWLSDKFPENEPLVCLTIDPTGLEIHESDVGYEVISYKTIPWKNVVKIEDI